MLLPPAGKRENGFCQQSRCDRFRHVHHEPRLEATSAVSRASAGGKGDGGNPTLARIRRCSDLAYQSIAVLIWHRDVGDDDINGVRGQRGHSCYD